jgi:hypothetical protein
MRHFKLIPFISTSEKDFRNSLPGGKEKYSEIIKKVYDNGSDTCPGCGYSTGHKESLQAHLQYWDETNHDTAEFILLCEGCHTLKHFDQAIEKGWVVLVNSVYSQSELIRRNRSSATIKKDLDEHKIVILKKTAKEYFDEILESDLNRNDKTKILFGNKFTWIK